MPWVFLIPQSYSTGRGHFAHHHTYTQKPTLSSLLTGIAEGVALVCFVRRSTTLVFSLCVLTPPLCLRTSFMRLEPPATQKDTGREKCIYFRLRLRLRQAAVRMNEA